MDPHGRAGGIPGALPERALPDGTGSEPRPRARRTRGKRAVVGQGVGGGEQGPPPRGNGRRARGVGTPRARRGAPRLPARPAAPDRSRPPRPAEPIDAVP
ncbi:hypothetical protein GCM10023329_39290 [Streptomyces sanyensis]|uniref:Uncharacterized protein n=1 Tax=Streptomyces sanyensis TaxID=568869 RepID=A0ABP9AQS7_9ACTN